jgi:hypothetical protein
MTTLLDWHRFAPLRRQQDQESQVVLEDRVVQVGRLRLARLRDPEVRGRPSDQVGLRRKRPIQALR